MALRVGTRSSRLALAQTDIIVNLLEGRGMDVEVIPVTTAGDRDQSTPLAEGAGWFTTAIQEALLERRIDFAVHSLKDLPTAEPKELVIAAIPRREDPRDVLITRRGARLAELPAGSTVGTSSPRRERQILAARPDLAVGPIRGNVDTRLAKLDAGDWDAIVLALAGLRRLGLQHRVTEVLEMTTMLPAPAQGALALECREGDEATRAALTELDDAETRAAVEAERAFLATLESGCSFPAAAYAHIEQGVLEIEALVANERGIARVVRAGPVTEARELGREVGRQLARQSAVPTAEGDRA